MTACNSALGQEGEGNDQLHTYASSLGIVLQAAPVELFSGELTRAYKSGGDSARRLPKYRLPLVLTRILLKTIYSKGGLFPWATKAESEGCVQGGEENRPLPRQHTLHSPVLEDENNSFAVKT